MNFIVLMNSYPSDKRIMVAVEEIEAVYEIPQGCEIYTKNGRVIQTSNSLDEVISYINGKKV